MKNLKAAVLALLLLPACRKSFSETLAKAEQSYSVRNYVNTIDTLNNGMDRWKNSDGNEKKARAYELLGLSYRELRNPEKASEAFEQALKLSDHVFDAAYGLGIINLTKSQAPAAQAAFETALRMKPNDPMALVGLGNSLFAQKKNRDAIAAFEKVLDVSPGVREAQESLAILKSRRAAPIVHSTPAPKKTHTAKKSKPQRKIRR